MNRPADPFTVCFGTSGKEGDYGVRYIDLTSYSAATMAALMERGGEPVCFPGGSKRVQFRIVVGYTHLSLEGHSH